MPCEAGRGSLLWDLMEPEIASVPVHVLTCVESLGCSFGRAPHEGRGQRLNGIVFWSWHNCIQSQGVDAAARLHRILINTFISCAPRGDEVCGKRRGLEGWWACVSRLRR